MAIDFSHLDLRMSYGTFDRLRRRLAQDLGIPWDRMEGHGQFVLEPQPHWELPEHPVPWSRFADPLVALLMPSDVDGEIPPEACLEISRRLRDLSWRWEETADEVLRDWAERLAEAMVLAAFLGEPFYWFG